MSEEPTEIKQMPKFDTPILTSWIKATLASDVKPKQAAVLLLQVFPDFDQDLYGDRDQRVEIVRQRLRSWKYDNRRNSTKEIKVKAKITREEAHRVSIFTNPIEQIEWLEHRLLTRQDLSMSEERAILSEILKLGDRVTGEHVAIAEGKSNYDGIDTSNSKSSAIWEDTDANKE